MEYLLENMEMEVMELVVPWLIGINEEEDDDFLIEMLAESRVPDNGWRGPNKGNRGISGYVEIVVPRYSLEEFRTLFHMSRSTFEVTVYK